MPPKKPVRKASRASASGDDAFRLLFLSHPTPMWIYDLETLAFLEVNDAAVYHYGYSRDDFLAMTIKDIRPPEDVPRLLDIVAHASEGHQESGEWRHRLKDGRIIDVAITSHKLRFQERNAKLVTAVDVSDRKRAEEALRASDERYRRFFDLDLTGDYLSAPDGTLLACNPAFAAMLGFASVDEALSADTVTLYASPEDRRTFLDLLARERVLRNHESHLVRRDGTLIHVVENVVGIFDDEGRLQQLQGFLFDITERKRAEDALRQKERLLSESQRIAHLGSWIWDVETLRITWSDEMYLIYGVTKGEFEPTVETLLGLIHHDDRAGMQEWLRAFTAGEGPGELVFRIVRPDGGLRWLLGRGTAERGADQRPVRGVGTAQDITDHRQAEDVLREAQERLQLAVSAGNVGLWDWDLRANEVFRSPEWKEQLGYERHEITSAWDEWRSRVHPDDLGRAEREAQASLAPPWPEYRSEFRLRHKDGSYRHILARGSLLFDALSKPFRMVGTHVDLTERAQLEAQLRQAQKMESVGQLAGGIAHDFNNLLTVINSYSELALGALKAGDPMREDLEQIHAAGGRAADLTRQLLAFSRKQVLQPVVLNLNALVTATEKMLRRLIGEDVDLALGLAPDLGTVTADPGQLEQVIVNLAVNARDAMPKGGKLTIETGDVDLDETYASQHAGARVGPYVMLAVSDTGTGMDEATRARIFEPFFTTKEVGRGTGLGLSTVYGIVKQSGGYVWVYSEIGVGTTFRIYLPRVAEAVRDARAVPAQVPARGTETVLIVEDEKALRRAAGRILASAGYTVLEAADGDAALELLAGHAGPLHLLLTDMVMPHMGGPEVAERIGALRPGIKVLFSSGYADDAILRHGILDQSVHFIAKPYSAAALTLKVREVLDGP